MDKTTKDRIQDALRRSWSSESSSLWSTDKPALGQCGVTALVVNDHFGGSILKTQVKEGWHFYNGFVHGAVDFTSEQFETLPEYFDLPASRAEVLEDSTESQYHSLRDAFARRYVPTR